ncbi:MAG TPA: sulfite exporter TauE/SafE family protein, partial [Syntrophorhabdaceae bacterium]|nr:sulfite exporter TauE/SafE family protein [Syntrophorhabdaceae bacterium]
VLLCGIGHIASSVFLGFIGIALGLSVKQLQIIESFRGNAAAWALIAFGLIYLAWGIRKAVRNKRHHHVHVHSGGKIHFHEHAHTDEHLHVHSGKESSLTPWVLFTIFFFGPCEPLIPILMYPAARQSLSQVITVTLIFGLITIATMLGLVFVILSGFVLFTPPRLERYNHAFAGATILLCGLAIQFMGL